ncbi:MAG: DUF190 domain-containing protein [Zetaproteobacteria bacterium]|nr:MAG: DUF190 domain-containing protein [Zetaproteobacteria bacterium]
MKQARFLRIYLLESDKIDGKPALEAVIRWCKEAGLSGLTVVRAIEGVGTHGVHSASFLALSSSLPLIVEAVDTPENIERAIAHLRPRIGHRLVVSWPVEVMRTDDHA